MDWGLAHRTPKLTENLSEIISCCCSLRFGASIASVSDLLAQSKTTQARTSLEAEPINFIMSIQYELISGTKLILE